MRTNSKVKKDGFKKFDELVSVVNSGVVSGDALCRKLDLNARTVTEWVRRAVVCGEVDPKTTLFWSKHRPGRGPARYSKYGNVSRAALVGAFSKRLYSRGAR